MFRGAESFTGEGLDVWITSSLTDLSYTFVKALNMNSDLTAWNVDKVTTMLETFRGAAKFVGTGLSAWNVAKVTTLDSAFRGVALMNSYLGAWDVAEVTSLAATFYKASKFDGSHLKSWNIAKVTKFKDTVTFTFEAATSLTSCHKREIADAWKSNSEFKDRTPYVDDWAAETCGVRLRFARVAYARTVCVFIFPYPVYWIV
jgi:hypothetical protein